MNTEITRKTKEFWNTEKTTATKHTQARQAQTGTQLHSSLTRKQGATLTQLRTGHCGLNQYLHRFNIIDDPQCECGHRNETVQHFLLDCRKHENVRKELCKNVGWRNMRVKNLLGDPKIVKETIEYVEKTGRFNFTNRRWNVPGGLDAQISKENGEEAQVCRIKACIRRLCTTRHRLSPDTRINEITLFSTSNNTVNYLSLSTLPYR